LQSADLAYRLTIDPDWSSSDALLWIQAQTGQDPASVINSGITYASSSETFEAFAALGYIRVIEALATEGSAELLTDLLSSQSPLMRLAKSTTDPRLRAEANMAVLSILENLGSDPSALTSTTIGKLRLSLAAIARMGDQPIAIIVDSDGARISGISSMLAGLGLQTRVVADGLALERLVASSLDVSLIISRENLPNVSPPELVDRVRRHPAGHDTVIAFFDDIGQLEELLRPADDYIDRSIPTSVSDDLTMLGLDKRWNAGVLRLPDWDRPARLRMAIDERQFSGLAPLSAVDRRRVSRRAMAALTDR
ncbi:MAG: hypothetical protein AAF664_10355, partial [Planctomycetota bacterium]